MKAFKLRAECLVDVSSAIALLYKATGTNVLDVEIKTIRKGFPDVTFAFKSNRSLDDLRKILSKVVDGHVMVESLDYKTQYTGERKYDRL